MAPSKLDWLILLRKKHIYDSFSWVCLIVARALQYHIRLCRLLIVKHGDFCLIEQSYRFRE
jgi:hypothetical protein